MVDSAVFQAKVQELIPDNGKREELFDSLRRYQSSQQLHQLLVDLHRLLDEPDKLELYEFIRPLILLRHQMDYSYLAPAVPGVRLRTIRLHRAPGQSLGFAVRGGYEFSVGVFVSHVEPGSQADKQGLKVGDEIVRVNGFTIAEAIHDDVLNLIKSRDEIVLKVTHIGMLPVKENASDKVTWQYVEDMDSKTALEEVLAQKQAGRGRGVELKIFIDCTGYDSIGCGILSGPSYYPGIFVEKVRPASLAEEVGLEVGDQIVEVNETSFLNIGHKEAVVVLKGSKQLNVVVRKHAGLPLFERHQTPARVSAVSANSSQAPSSPSPPNSQRSAPWPQQRRDSSGLDEGQLIAEQLNRSSLLGRPTSSFSPPPDSSPFQPSAEQVRISTQAEVHSDSDSLHAGWGDGPAIPTHEPAPADNPASPSLTPPSATPLPMPADLHDPDNPASPSLTPPSATPFPMPDDLHDPVDHPATPSLTPSSATPLPIQELLCDSPTPQSATPLLLPDDLGDPVLAVLRRPYYPPDSPSWVLPSMHFNVPDTHMRHRDNGLDPDPHPRDLADLGSSQQPLSDGRCDSPPGHLSFSALLATCGPASDGGSSCRSGGGAAADGERGLQSQADGVGTGAAHCRFEAGRSGADGSVESRAAEGENFRLVKSEGQGSSLGAESPAGFHSGADLASFWVSAHCPERRSLTPVFVPPPPPTSPPPPTTSLPPPPHGVDSPPTSSPRGRSSSASRLSTASTQTLQAEGVEESSPAMGQRQTASVRDAARDSPATADQSGAGTGRAWPQQVDAGPEAAEADGDSPRGNGAGGQLGGQYAGCGERLPVGAGPLVASTPQLEEPSTRLSEGVGHSPYPSQPGGRGGGGVDPEVRVEVHRFPSTTHVAADDTGGRAASGAAFAFCEAPIGEHDFPPPPPSFFQDEGGDGNLVPHPALGDDTPVFRDDTPTHTDDTHTHTHDTFTDRNDIPTHTDDAPPLPASPTVPPPPPPPPLPPALPPPFPLALGGAAAVAAARREAQEEELSPRLLGPAEPGLSADGLQHARLAALFSPLELDGRELKAFVFPKNMTLGIEMEGGMGTPLAGKIVVAAVFDGGVAVEQGLQTGDQLMMINGHKLTDITVAEAERILDEAYGGPKEMIQVVYTQSNFLNDEECVTYF